MIKQAAMCQGCGLKWVLRKNSVCEDCYVEEEMKKEQLVCQMLNGETDIYQIHTSPEGDLQKELSKEIDTLYNEAAQDGHHLDDDAEAIYKSILGQYENLLKHYLGR
jgi:hypothetical protein